MSKSPSTPEPVTEVEQVREASALEGDTAGSVKFRVPSSVGESVVMAFGQRAPITYPVSGGLVTVDAADAWLFQVSLPEATPNSDAAAAAVRAGSGAPTGPVAGAQTPTTVTDRLG